MGEFSESNTERSALFIKGELMHEIFHNAEEQFTIAKIAITETNEDFAEKEIVIKGHIPSLQPGESYVFHGQFVRHAKFGTQYEIERYETYIPNSKAGLIDYLSSDLFYGIGPKTAENIVEYLGPDPIAEILADEHVLDGVPRLKADTKEQLINTLRAHQGFEHVVVYLGKYEIGLKLAHKIYKQYHSGAIDLLEEDPYQFVYDIEGFGFQTADKIARQNGLDENHPNRIGAACLYVLQRASSEGHVYLPKQNCAERVWQLLRSPQLTQNEISKLIETLAKEDVIKVQKERVYLPALFYAEAGFATDLERILNEADDSEVDLAELLKTTGEIEEETIISYGKEQFKAIEMALKSKVMILTGGPGTGKTTVVKGIIHSFAKINQIALPSEMSEGDEKSSFILTAPTGRAAKRLAESTGLEAVTIHRLLGWDGGSGFEKNEQEKLDGKMLIIDEFSMVDTWLAFNLFRAIPNNMHVLIVGDEDQLPSVGPGQVLSDLLQADRIPSVTLDEVYRQKEGSKIIQLAHSMKRNELSQADLKSAADFSFISCDESHLVDAIVKIFSRALDKGMDPRDLQVLAPIYRSQAGINEINKALQQLVNPPEEKKREVAFHEIFFRRGDKVLQLVNQPEDGIYNGDIGEVVAIFRPNENKEKMEQLVVLFDDKEVVYVRKNYQNLMHAYCISIHKSQGSEFQNVLLPIASSYMRMLKKNLLYTAITRAEQSLIICGNVGTFLRGVQIEDTNRRFTSLRDHLGNEQEQGFVEESPWTIRIPLTDAEVVEDRNLSPYDFLQSK